MKRRRRWSGSRALTLVEVTVSLGLLALVAAMVLGFEAGVGSIYAEQELLSALHHRARLALTTIAADVGGALTTTGGELETFDPGGGAGGRALQLRQVVGATASGPVWGPTLIVTSPGATSGDGSGGGLAAAGIVRLRGTDLHLGAPLDAFAAARQGADGLWGTRDDGNEVVAGQVAVRTLLPATMAPSTGDMLRFDLAGRLVTITIRCNMRRGTGWLLPNDLVLTERVGLKQ